MSERRLVLKVDVDTWRGTRDGVPRLVALFQRLAIPATFLFSLGPDHTGRALKRVFRRGFLSKVRRTSVVSNYGIRTLLYGVLLPGPRIGRRCRDLLRDVHGRGFEVGVHCYDHVKWQDGVARASEAWTRRQLELAVAEFRAVFGFAPLVHGAAGWQVNSSVPRLQQELGFRVASDTRGRHAFAPDGGGVAQFPTTLPTLDELIGAEAATAQDAIDLLLKRTAASAGDEVFTLHAELEGAAYLPDFERLLIGWRDQGFRFVTLGDLAAATETTRLPRCPIVAGTVEGRSGELAVQGAA